MKARKKVKRGKKQSNAKRSIKRLKQDISELTQERDDGYLDLVEREKEAVRAKGN